VSSSALIVAFQLNDDHGVSLGNTGQLLAQWRHPIASRVALDLPYWAMCLALYHLIHMAIEMASVVGAFFLSLILCHA